MPIWPCIHITIFQFMKNLLKHADLISFHSFEYITLHTSCLNPPPRTPPFGLLRQYLDLGQHGIVLRVWCSETGGGGIYITTPGSID